MYRPKIISDRKESIKQTLDGIQQKQSKVVTTAEYIIRDNKRCEGKLLEILRLLLDTAINEDMFLDITLEQMHKGTILLLTAFIKIRMNCDLTTSVVTASLKGSPLDVRNKVVDKKQKGLCCLNKHTSLGH